MSYLARYTGQTHALYTYQLRRWFSWCDANTLDPLVGIGRTSSCTSATCTTADLRDSSINTMLHGVRGFFRFAHIDGLITADPAVYARLPKVFGRRGAGRRRRGRAPVRAPIPTIGQRVQMPSLEASLSWAHSQKSGCTS